MPPARLSRRCRIAGRYARLERGNGAVELAGLIEEMACNRGVNRPLTDGGQVRPSINLFAEGWPSFAARPSSSSALARSWGTPSPFQ